MKTSGGEIEKTKDVEKNRDGKIEVNRGRE